jgi:GTP-binding protein
MLFVDEALIHVQGGHGGHGCMSFRRERAVPRGGPDGGNGGDGGDVVLQANPNLNTLVDFCARRLFRAQRGGEGGSRHKAGARGADCVIEVPLGTMVFDANTDTLLGELLEPEAMLVVAHGGQHGLGNRHFRTSTNRAPRMATPGEPGEMAELRLELKILADVGLVGLPNAGKSSLLRAMSAARPKVADYPFTTLHPHLGTVELDAEQRFVVADIPGLVAGAASGLGLGNRFLRHAERTGLLVQVVDASDANVQHIREQIAVVEHELHAFGLQDEAYPRWLVLNKMDLLTAKEQDRFRQELQEMIPPGTPLFLVSALDGSGVLALCYKLAQVISTATLRRFLPAVVSSEARATVDCPPA